MELLAGMPTPMYQLPFQAEVGEHVSFEDMQQLVSRRKQRPRFPDVWKDTNPVSARPRVEVGIDLCGAH